MTCPSSVISRPSDPISAAPTRRPRTRLSLAQAIYEEQLVTNHPEVASLLNRLGILYQSRGMYGRAEPLHRRALSR